MGNSEEGKPSKAEKSSPAPPDQANIHVYPDWAAMQAYYGPRVAIPPYYNSVMASGHAPHPFIWGPPQAMMPPYGAPYAAFCPPGGVYPHPGVPMGTPQVNAVPSSSSTANTPLSIDTLKKSSGNAGQGFMKKLKEFDGLAMSIGNGSAEGAERMVSQSSEMEGSSSGSGNNTSEGEHTKRKRSRESPSTGAAAKFPRQLSPASAEEVNENSGKVLGATVPPGNASVKPIRAVISPGMTTALELRNSSSAIVPHEPWLQNDRELKRERRKQSNRESARRSRLRKQAEAEDLARKVDSLSAENMTLRSEINQLTEKSNKLRLENGALMGKLKNGHQLEHAEEIGLSSAGNNPGPPVSTENFLSRVNNSGSADTNAEKEDNNLYEKNSNTGTKLHQLLDTKPRTDAVAAG